MNSKKCTKCGEVKGLSYFTKSKSSKDGLHCYCKDCVKLYSRAYYLSNKDRLIEYQTKWGKKNKELKKVYRAKWVKKNPENVALHQKNYYQKNRAKINEDQNKLMQKYREELSDYYIKKKLCANSNLLHKDISKELIELKRSQLKLHRACQ